MREVVDDDGVVLHQPGLLGVLGLEELLLKFEALDDEETNQDEEAVESDYTVSYMFWILM